MIHFRELRIGNCVKRVVGSDCWNEQIDRVDTSIGFAETVFPIPITREILKKCGFEINIHANTAAAISA